MTFYYVRKLEFLGNLGKPLCQVTPLGKYFDIFKGIKEAEKAKKLKKEMDDYKFIPEAGKKAKKTEKKVEEFKGIFGDDEDEDNDEIDDAERFKLKKERGQKRGQNLRDDPVTSSSEDEDEPEVKKGKNDLEVEGSNDEDSTDDEDDEVKDFDDFSD